MDLILPETPEWSLEAVVKFYIRWLQLKSPGHEKSFTKRLSEDPDAAHAEAVVFNLLRIVGRKPRPNETLDDKGGVDFICDEKEPHLAVEVTALQTDAVTAASGLHSPLKSGGVYGFGQITSKLMSEAVNKAKQMSGYP